MEKELHQALVKLAELQRNCFPFQGRARDLIAEVIEHVTNAQEKYEDEGYDIKEQMELMEDG